MVIVKIGNVQLTEQEASSIYSAGKYVVTFSRVYQLFYSVNAGYYGQEVYRCPKGQNMAKRGRFHVMNGNDVNRLIGIELLK